MRGLTCLSLVLSCAATSALAQQQPSAPAAPAGDPPPRTWVDPETGHRIVRLSDDAGSQTLYFHDNSFSPEGDKFMFTTPGGIAVFDVAKIGSEGAKLEIVATGGLSVGRRPKPWPVLA